MFPPPLNPLGSIVFMTLWVVFFAAFLPLLRWLNRIDRRRMSEAERAREPDLGVMGLGCSGVAAFALLAGGFSLFLSVVVIEDLLPTPVWRLMHRL